MNKMDFDKLHNEGLENVPMQQRRDFLKMGLAITGIFAGGTLLSAVSTFNKAQAADFAKKYPYKPHYSMVMHQDRCIDCERCMEACVATNHVPQVHGAYRTTILEKETPDAMAASVIYPGALQPVQPAAVRSCLSHQGHLQGQDPRHRHDEHQEVHRLPDLPGGLPLQCPLLQRRKACR